MNWCLPNLEQFSICCIFLSLSTSFHTTIFTDSFIEFRCIFSVHQFYDLNFLCDFPGVHKRFLATLFIFKYHYTASHVVQIIQNKTPKSVSFPMWQYSNWLQLAQRLKRLFALQATWVRSLGQEDPLEKEMATHSSILAWRIPWMEEPGGLQSMGSQRVGHDRATSLSPMFIITYPIVLILLIPLYHWKIWKLTCFTFIPFAFVSTIFCINPSSELYNSPLP